MNPTGNSMRDPWTRSIVDLHYQRTCYVIGRRFSTPGASIEKGSNAPRAVSEGAERLRVRVISTLDGA